MQVTTTAKFMSILVLFLEDIASPQFSPHFSSDHLSTLLLAAWGAEPWEEGIIPQTVVLCSLTSWESGEDLYDLVPFTIRNLMQILSTANFFLKINYPTTVGKEGFIV